MTEDTRRRACKALLHHNYECNPRKASLVIFPAAFVFGSRIFLYEYAAIEWARETADDLIPRTVEIITYREAYDELLRNKKH